MTRDLKEWPPVFNTRKNIKFIIDEEMSLIKLYSQTAFNYENIYDAGYEDVYSWMHSLNGKYFNDVKNSYLYHEDPFERKRSVPGKTSFKNETKCFSKIQDIYNEQRPGEKHYAMSVLKFSHNRKNLRIWGFTRYDSNEDVFYFCPVMFDPKHVGIPVFPFHKTQSEICHSTCGKDIADSCA